MSEQTDDLEQRLRHLRQDVVFPPTPALASSVRAELDHRPRRAGGPGNQATDRFGWPRWALAGLAAVVTLVVTVVAVPASRAVVFDWLNLPGVRIELVGEDESEPPAPPSGVGMTLLLGERMTLAEAATTMPFTIRIPGQTRESALGAPDEVYVRRVDRGVLVSLLYLPRPGLPEIDDTGVGALLMQFRTAEEIDLVVKGVVGSESVESLRIGDQHGYWVRDGQLYIAPDPAGYLPIYDGTTRPSGNVLLWADGGVTFRLETALDRTAAVILATSLLPFDGTPPIGTAAQARHSGHEAPSKGPVSLVG